MKAGAAERDITPPDGSIMACFPLSAGKPRRASGAHDRLMSKAVAFAVKNAEPFVICSIDTCMMRRESIERILCLIRQRLPALDPARIIFASTHTHSGPDTAWLFGGTPADREIIDIETAIADSILAAVANMEDAVLEAGNLHVALSHNRRVKDDSGKTIMQFVHEPGVTDGPADHEMILMHFRRKSDASTIAVLYNYAAHALTVGAKNMLYTADFPGEVRRILEPELGGQIIFLNGAAGDIHPRISMQSDFSALITTGRQFAEAIRTILKNTRPVEAGTLALVREDEYKYGG